MTKIITDRTARNMYKKFMKDPDNVKVLGKNIRVKNPSFYFAFNSFKSALKNKGFKIK
jgi:hypothetical protein